MSIYTLTWLQLALLLVGTCGQLEQIVCPDGWSCKTMVDNKWKAVSQEESLTVVYDNFPSVSIVCDDQRHLDLPNGLLSNFSFPLNVTFFYFSNCQLPVNTTYKAILSGRTVVTLRLLTPEPLHAGLKPQAFRGLDFLTYLNLVNCGVTSLPKSLFSFTPKIVTLKLTDNLFTQLPPDLFEFAPNLVNLELGNNQLVKLTDRMIGLDNLQVLHLYNNRIEKISRNFFSSLPSLLTVDLQDNKIVSVSEDLLRDVTKLQKLKIFTNKLRTIPEDFLANQTQLTEISLNDNPNLSELPVDLLHHSPALLTFTIERCNISVIPTSFFDTPSLANLSFVSFSRNVIKDIEPQAFAQLTNVSVLLLDFNRLTEIGKDTFSGLRKLQKLNLNNNDIQFIDPGSFVDQNRLITLNLASNRLTAISQNLFDFTSELESLDLSHNLLVNVVDASRGLFNLPSSIVIVDLSYNRLRSLPSDWIVTNTFLTSIDLSHNELSVFNAGDCQPTSDQLTLDISFNNISRAVFDIFVLDQLAALSGPVKPRIDRPKVIIENNPFVCDCHTDDLLRYFVNQNVNLYPFILQMDNLLCISPAIFAGRPVISLQPSELFCEEQRDCPSPCRCLKHAVGNVVEVDCRHSNLTDIPKTAPKGVSVLRVDDNWLTDMTNINESAWESLNRLLASNNNISRLDADVLPVNLVELDLRGNRLNVLDRVTLNTLNASNALQLILLQDNPWNCDNCDNENFRDFLNGNINRVGNVSTIFCNGTKRQLFLEPICVTAQTLSKNILVVTVIVCFATAMGLAAAAIGYYRYNQEIKVWLYAHRMCLWLVKEKEIDKNKRFDAFISFSQEDAEFVASHLMPGLEDNEPFYKLCVHHRDWLAGEWIPDQIIRSVQDSRRTIVVLSKNFIKSVWGRLEFKAAHHQALQDRTNRIIILVVGDLPPSSEMDPDLKMYVKFNTYLKWGDVWFWQKLRYAMPHSPIRASVPPPSFRNLRRQNGDPNGVATRLAVLK